MMENELNETICGTVKLKAQQFPFFITRIQEKASLTSSHLNMAGTVHLEQCWFVRIFLIIALTL